MVSLFPGRMAVLHWHLTGVANLKKPTGIDCGFEYQNLKHQFAEADIQAYCDRTRKLFSTPTKAWTNELNTIWLIRHYLAVKYIIAASIMIASADYADDRKLFIPTPYLIYYSILNCCRAYLFTVPDFVWKGAASVEMTHQNIINSTANYIRRIDGNAEKNWGDRIRLARDDRELFSYRFPATGLKFWKDRDHVGVGEAIKICSVLSEMAQINSECLEASLSKNAKGSYRFLPDNADVELAISYSDAQLDDEDYYRIGYFIRKSPTPHNLLLTAREGLVEDAFGAWLPQDDLSEEDFDIDRHWRIIFPFM